MQKHCLNFLTCSFVAVTLRLFNENVSLRRHVQSRFRCSRHNNRIDLIDSRGGKVGRDGTDKREQKGGEDEEDKEEEK